MKNLVQRLSFICCSLMLVMFVTVRATENNRCLQPDAAQRPVLILSDPEDNNNNSRANNRSSLEAEIDKLKQRNHDLQQQQTILEKHCRHACGREHDQLQRTRDQLQEQNVLLEKQNRILAEFCPILQEIAKKEFTGGVDPDIAAAWGLE